jgi:hypothetical protein
MLTTWKKEHILDKRGEHVPWLQMHEGADEVKTICGCRRDHNVTECRIGFEKSVAHTYQILNHQSAEMYSLWEILPTLKGVRDRKINGEDHTPQSDGVANTEQDNGQDVQPFGTLEHSA